MCNVAKFAARYAEIGLALTWTPQRQKGPRHAGWNDPAKAITDPELALDRWKKHPHDGVACLLASSRLVSLDIDDEARSALVLDRLGINLAALREASPCIVGRHFRLMFRAPAENLTHRAVTWPKRDNLAASSVLFELRAGNIADTLPPTMHPGTGQPYRWENPPRNGFPELPQRLLALWRDWDATHAAALALCPWYVAPKRAPQRERKSIQPGESVIDQFNRAHDAAAILEAHGYTRKGKRFASPGTMHAPGVVILESGKVFAHHQGDVLHAEHALDAFDLWRVLDHGGDFRAAVKAAAEALGINNGRATA